MDLATFLTPKNDRMNLPSKSIVLHFHILWALKPHQITDHELEFAFFPSYV
jgi:hypothetical protein